MNSDKADPLMSALLKDFDFTTFFQELAFKESHYKAVGKISVEFSMVEFFLAHYISHLAGTNLFVGKIITLDVRFPRLLVLFKRLFRLRERNTSTQEQLNNILSELNDLHSRRGEIVHSLWDYDFANKKFVMQGERADASVIVKPTIEEFQVDDLNKIGERLTVVINQFIQFMENWLKQQPPNTT